MSGPARGALGRKKLVALALLLVFALATNLAPHYPHDQLLQQGPALFVLVVLCVVARRHPISDAAFFLALAFLALHEFAARWIYSNVPYDAWTQALFGWRLGERLGWQRNHFDRLVHFSAGVLLLPVLEQWIRSGARTQAGWARAGAWAAIVSLSACYELGEWAVAVTFAPERAESYVGQQGDAWDAQKDMALAVLGASLCAAWRALTTRRGELA